MKIRIVSISFIAILFSTIFPSVWIVTAKVANGKGTMIGLQPGQNTTRVNSFSYNVVLNISNNNRTSADPQIDISGNNTYVVWSDESAGNPDIFFTKSTDGGNTFSDRPINLSKNKGNSSDPEVFSDNKNDIFVVWDDDSPGNADIFFTKSTDGGETFSKPVNLSNNTMGSFDPALTISKNHILVAWDDDSPGNADILFTKSTDRGNSFSIKPINLSKNVGRSLYPDVALSRSATLYGQMTLPAIMRFSC